MEDQISEEEFQKIIKAVHDSPIIMGTDDQKKSTALEPGVGVTIGLTPGMIHNAEVERLKSEAAKKDEQSLRAHCFDRAIRVVKTNSSFQGAVSTEGIVRSANTILDFIKNGSVPAE